MNITDCPPRARVRVVPVYDSEGNQTGTTQVPAEYAWVGFVKINDTRRKFWIAADDLTDSMWQSPEGEQGPEIGVLCKIDRNGDFRCGGYDEDCETPAEGIRKHGIRLHRALLVKWYQAGILRNPV